MLLLFSLMPVSLLARADDEAPIFEEKTSGGDGWAVGDFNGDGATP